MKIYPNESSANATMPSEAYNGYLSFGLFSVYIFKT